MQYFLAKHHFYSKDTKAKAEILNVTTQKNTVLEKLNSDDATVLFTAIPKHELFQYCYWVAKDEKSIRKNIEPFNMFWQKTDIEEVDQIIFWGEDNII